MGTGQSTGVFAKIPKFAETQPNGVIEILMVDSHINAVLN
jgi:hypothetical protein